jgi:hypothetical protein
MSGDVKPGRKEDTVIERIRAISAAVSILMALAAVTAAQGTATLTNDDVIKMVRAQLAAGIIETTIESSSAKFDVSPAGLIALKDAGVPDSLVRAMQEKMRKTAQGASTDSSTRTAPEKSELLTDAKDPVVVLRNFKTMLIDASKAVYFGTAQMKAALGQNKGFAPLNVSIVDDHAVADVVLNVSYTFAWDYPFTVKHQNTSVVLLTGKGTGPFSGPAGAANVATELVKALKPYRVAAR